MSSSSSENKDNTTPPAQPPVQQPDNYYQRKKNWISGIDNDTLLGLGVGLTATVASIAAFPIIKNAWENFVNRPPQLPPNPPLPPPVEDIIPPTPPVQQNPVVNGGVHPTDQPTEQTGQSNDQPTEQTGQSNDQKEEEDGLFHETELRRRQKLMGQRPRGSNYSSPFGKDVGGL